MRVYSLPPIVPENKHNSKRESHPERWWNGGIPSGWRECCVHSEQLELADHCRVPRAARILHFPDASFQSGMSLLILTHGNVLCVTDSSRRLLVSSAWTLAMRLSVPYVPELPCYSQVAFVSSTLFISHRHPPSGFWGFLVVLILYFFFSIITQPHLHLVAWPLCIRTGCFNLPFRWWMWGAIDRDSECQFPSCAMRRRWALKMPVRMGTWK